MTIDDLIVKYRTMSTKGNILFPQRPDIAEKSNLQYKETADYLEELKSYRANEGMSENVYRCGYKSGYNRAIDDFTDKFLLELSESVIWGMLIECHKDNSFNYTADKIVEYVVDVARNTSEQLKGVRTD